MITAVLLAAALGGQARCATVEVRAELVSRGTWVGVRFAIPSGKHIYWTNPGDAGLPTRIEFGLPKGFKAGPLQWPVPEEFVQPGDITGYGYRDELLVWARIEGPPDGPPVGEKVWAAVSWLECDRRECVPGRADLNADWPPPAATGLFSAWEPRLPERAGSAAPVGSSPGKWEISIPWKGRGGSVKWVAAADPRVVLTDVSIRPGDPLRIACTVAAAPGGKMPAGPVEALVAYKAFWGPLKGIAVAIPRGEVR